MDAQTLKTELDAASYRDGDGKRAGTYDRNGARWRISSRGCDDVDGRVAPSVLEVTLSGGDVAAVTNTPGVKFVNKMLVDTIKRGASDIHFEPYEREYRVRYRMDGILRTVAKPPIKLSPRISSRLKVMSGLDIAERRLPQDGRLSTRVGGQEMDIRVSALPGVHGESIVMRLLPKERKELGLERLGFEADHLAMMKEWTAEANGIVLVTGPTGSGKSTTLSAMVNYLNETEFGHILTVEDPIEFVHESKKCLINQREVGPMTLSFAAALKSALREDPDAILVGEMRDLETIRLAMTAAETGHLVFGTLHTSSAAKTIDRIIDVFPAEEKEMVRAMLSESLQAVISQTLCKTKDGSGRVAAHEIMLGTSAIRNLIREAKVAQMYSTIQTSNSVGMQTLDQNLTDLVRRNIISPAEARSKAKIPENFPG